MAFDQVAQAIVSNTGNVLLCAGIILIAIGIYFLYLLPRVRHTKRDLQAAVSRLEEIADESAMAVHFEEFDDFAREHPVVGHAWREFADTLLAPAPGVQPPVFRNSREAAEFFNLESVLESRINTRLVGAVPGYMTGLGILGTFVGLVAGIFLASRGMDTGDIQKMRASLQPLLSGAALAFWTSICGLACSLSFSVAEKRQFHSIERLLGRWNEALDRRLRRVTPEQLVAEQVGEATKQTLQLERFNTDLAVSIAQALDRQLSQSFSPRLDQMVTGISDLKSHQSEFSQDVLTRVSSEISRAVSGATGVEMTAVAETLKNLVSVLQQSAGALNEGHGEMTRAVDELMRRMQGAFGESATHLTQETGRAIEKMMTYLDAAGGAAAGQLRSASEVAAVALTGAASGASATLSLAGDRVAQQLDTAATRLGTQFDEAGGAAARQLRDASKDVVSALSGAASGVSTSLGTAGERIVLQLDSVLGRLGGQFDEAGRNAASQLRGASQEAAVSLSGAAERINATFDSVGAGASERLSTAARDAAALIGQSATSLQQSYGQYERGLDQIRGVLQTAAEAQASLKGVIQALQETHGAFRATVAPVQQAVVRLGEVQQAVAAQLQGTSALASSLTATANGVKDSLVTMQQAWNNHERRFEEIDKSAESFFGQIREGVDAYTSSIKGFVGELDVQFAKALRELSSVVNELETTVDGLEHSIRLQAGSR